MVEQVETFFLQHVQKFKHMSKDQMRATNASYGCGVGAEAGLIIYHAMAFDMFTNEPVSTYSST